MVNNQRVFVAGHGGLVGSAICRALEAQGVATLTATRAELDLRHQTAVNAWFDEHRPDQVYLVAGTVGGIGANIARPAEFIYDNLMIHGTVVEAAKQTGVDKLLYLGSSCIYPREAAQPIAESALLSGELEPTNEAYALAKIAGIKLCESYRRQYGCNFISAMPTNLYGPGDNFDLEGGHVIPMLMRRFHEAKLLGNPTLQVWGTGSARREFLHVDDLADACLVLMRDYEGDQHINVGTGRDLPVGDLARLLRDIVYPEATIVFDDTKPDGMPRKVLDVSRINDLGWRHHIELADGLRSTYDWFVDHYDSARGMTQDLAVATR